MDIVLVGAGNVANQIAKTFQKKNISIKQIYSRTLESAQKLAKEINVSFTNNLAEIDRQADVYFYAVKDSALEEIIRKINIREGLHIHTAGSIPISVFEGFAEKYGVFYPLQTFSKTREIDFTHIPIFIEGNSPVSEQQIFQLAHLLCDKIFIASSEQRQLIHLSAVFACNFSNHMFNIANEIVAQAGFSFEILKPLIDETVQKLNDMTPFEAQTGPAVRNDENVIQKHLSLLANRPELAHLYKTISDHIYKTHLNQKK
ncbi:MAG TPA: DUF2520 domain-containing protein [Paludibacteraceae bacterium]|nr:DUF2520 domain-containing protein [Paludibacteraceae bacterium]